MHIIGARDSLYQVQLQSLKQNNYSTGDRNHGHQLTYSSFSRGSKSVSQISKERARQAKRRRLNQLRQLLDKLGENPDGKRVKATENLKLPSRGQSQTTLAEKPDKDGRAGNDSQLSNKSIEMLSAVSKRFGSSVAIQK